MRTNKLHLFLFLLMCFCLNLSVQAEASINIIKGKVTCEGKGMGGSNGYRRPYMCADRRFREI